VIPAEHEVSPLTRRTLAERPPRAAVVLALVALGTLSVTPALAQADGDLVVKRTTIRHPGTSPAAAPSPSPGRDVVVLDPVPSPPPPRIPEEISPAATSSPAASSAWRAVVQGWMVTWLSWVRR